VTSDLLTHRIAGEGSPVVLLNGGMMTFPSWEPIASRLRQRHRTLLFDFRGQLLSPGEPAADLAGHADDLLALLDAVGWRSAHFAGASFGAEVAIELAARTPERVRTLTLITAMDRATDEFRRGTAEMREALAEVRGGGERGRFYDVLVEGVYSKGYRSAQAETLAARRAAVDQLPLEWFEGVDALLDAVADFDLTDRLARIRAPALVVIAGDDRVMAPERSVAMAAARGAETVVHPTSGHALVAEEPAWLAEVCLEFLSRHDDAGAAV
jgi:pimeloyl-ACP methyl ester carboxylesterase